MRPIAKTTGPKTPARNRLAPGILALPLFLLVFVLFSPSLRFELVDLDDITYVANNSAVLDGFSASTLRQAFSLDNPTATMYMPLLWVSYLLDVDGLGATPARPWGFHFTNVLLHSINSALLFGLLLGLGRRPGLAFFLAALWALHPLRVESVAWVTERKDVLSGLFALLALGTYVRMATRPRQAGQAPVRPSIPRLAAALFFFACGLLVKPALAPLPLVLLLLDFWPLRRFEFSAPALRQAAPRILLEKIPFFLLAGLAASGTVWGHHVVSGELQVSLGLRLLTVPLAYGFYALKTVLPFQLSVLVPYFSLWFPPPVLKSLAAAATVVLVALTVWAWRSRQRAPQWLVGWLWFLAMLLPVCGLVPIPTNDVADRFSYLPAAGLSIALLALARPVPGVSGTRRGFHFVGATVVLLVLSVLTLRQLPFWRNTDTLYSRILEVFPRHATALKNRAAQLMRATGDFRQANELIDRALQAEPRHWEAHFAKAQCLAELEGPAAAQRHLLGIVPPTSRFTHAYWRRDLARYALMLGQPEDALRHVDQALPLLPPHDLSRLPFVLLGMAAAFEQGDETRALAFARQFPPYAQKTSLELADLLPHAIFQWVAGYRRDAWGFFQRLAQTYPDRPDLLNNIAWGLSTADWSPAAPREVLELATRLSGLVSPPHPGILDTLAAAQANAGDFDSAIRTLREALALFPANPDPNLAAFKERLTARLALYERHVPYREDAFTRMYVTYFGDISATQGSQSP